MGEADDTRSAAACQMDQRDDNRADQIERVKLHGAPPSDELATFCAIRIWRYAYQD